MDRIVGFKQFHGHWMRKQGVELEDEDTHDNKDEVPDGVLPTMHKHVEEHPMRSDKDCGGEDSILFLMQKGKIVNSFC